MPESSQYLMLKPNALAVVSRSETGKKWSSGQNFAFLGRTGTLIDWGRLIASPFYHVRAYQQSTAVRQRVGPHQTPLCWWLDCGLWSLQDCNKLGTAAPSCDCGCGSLRQEGRELKAFLGYMGSVTLFQTQQLTTLPPKKKIPEK